MLEAHHHLPKEYLIRVCAGGQRSNLLRIIDDEWPNLEQLHLDHAHLCMRQLRFPQCQLAYTAHKYIGEASDSLFAESTRFAQAYLAA
jgi:hypothetical protein